MLTALHKNLAKVNPETFVDSPVNPESLAMPLKQEPLPSYLCCLQFPMITLRVYSFLVNSLLFMEVYSIKIHETFILVISTLYILNTFLKICCCFSLYEC